MPVRRFAKFLTPSWFLSRPSQPNLPRHKKLNAVGRGIPAVACFETLEERALMATFSVTSTDDSGAGSLRQAMLSANGTPGADRIEFNLPGTGVSTILLASALPTITEQVTIDGSTQPGYSQQPLIELNGSAVVGHGLTIAAGGSEIRGLAINRFQGNGILVTGSDAQGNRIVGNAIGTDAAGTVDLGNARNGIQIQGANNNIIGGLTGLDRNIISGNAERGIRIEASGTLVMGNFIGTNAAGTADLGNSSIGVNVLSGSNNVIGGSTVAARNIISGNDFDGVRVEGTLSTDNVVRANYIGTDVSGMLALPNSQAGVALFWGTVRNWIGGYGQFDGNVISGNQLYGVSMGESSDNFVATNKIGLATDGEVPLPNGSHGVTIFRGRNNEIGGIFGGNWISSNGGIGVQVYAEATDVRVYGNFIGLNAKGDQDRGNGSHGVHLDNVAGNRVGGISSFQGNRISGNQGSGVVVSGSLATANLIEGNYIGTDAGGVSAIGNSQQGVHIHTGANGNTISSGGTERGVISGNGADGIRIEGTGTVNNVVRGQYIGTDQYGIKAIPNVLVGVHLRASSSRTIIGGFAGPALGNLIAGNALNGISIVSSNQNSIMGNRIGVDIAGQSLPNGGYGIQLNNANDNTIGTPNNTNVSLYYPNTIANNRRQGVFVTAGVRNTIRGNSIFNNNGLGIDLNPVNSTPNDLLDIDQGANGLLNHPVLHSVQPGTTAVVSGRLQSSLSSAFTIDFYVNSQSDAVRQGEGARWLGSHQITTDALGNANFTVVLPEVSASEYVSSTTTDSQGNTSEFSRKMQRDTISPTSRIVSIDSPATSLSIPVTVTGTDPETLSEAASGVKEYQVFVSVDGAAFLPWTVVPGFAPSAVFPAQSNHSYTFRSVAVDWAGNVESKLVTSEASVYVPDLEPPTTEVTSVNSSQRLFQVELSGIDAGGAGIREFVLELKIDTGPYQKIATVAAQIDQAGTLYKGFTTYQAIADGQQHTYRFRAIGIDWRGNKEEPSEEADVFVTAIFQPPVSMAVANFDVQGGATQRSLIQYLDVTFNMSSGVQDIVGSLADSDVTNDRIRLRRFNLDGGGTGDRVLLNNRLNFNAVDNVMRVDFGSSGITGDPLTLNGNGYYALEFDFDGDGVMDDTLNFYRLLGDVNGDRVVNALDNLQVSRRVGTTGDELNEDLNGDGAVSLVDTLAVRRGIGRFLAASLSLDD